MQHQARADAQVVLVVVDAVVEGGYKIVGLDETKREAVACAEVEASAEVGGPWIQPRIRVPAECAMPISTWPKGWKDAWPNCGR